MKKIVTILLALTLLCTPLSVYANNGDSVVHITKTGEKYHNAGCSYLKSDIPISLSNAVSQGYTPCSRCNPPVLTADPAPVSESQPAPQPTPESQPIAEPQPIPESQPVTEPQPAPELQPVTESQAVVETQPISQSTTPPKSNNTVTETSKQEINKAVNEATASVCKLLSRLSKKMSEL